MKRRLQSDARPAPLVLLFCLALGCTSSGGSAASTDGPPALGQDARADVASGGADGASQDATADAIGQSDAARDGTTSACPASRPAASADCPVSVGSCPYGDVVCACYASRIFLPDGGMSTRQVWDCAPQPPAPCPRSAPADGAPCDREGLRCNYDVRACAAGNPTLHVCERGVWRVHLTPCSSSGSLDDAGVPSCASAFAATLVKDCSSPADCTLAAHDDCCGTVKVGIRKGTEAAFDSAEKAYLACVPGCGLRGCFHAEMAEEGGAPGTGQAIVAECRAGRCLSVVRSAAVTCTTSSDCGAGRLCVAFVTNVGPTSTTARECRTNPCGGGPLTCACAGAVCSAPTPLCSVRGDQLTCDDGRQ